MVNKSTNRILDVEVKQEMNEMISCSTSNGYVWRACRDLSREEDVGRWHPSRFSVGGFAVLMAENFASAPNE